MHSPKPSIQSFSDIKERERERSREGGREFGREREIVYMYVYYLYSTTAFNTCVES